MPDRDRLRPVLIQVREPSADRLRIEGILGVTRGRYLHLDTRLWYTGMQIRRRRRIRWREDPLYMELREERRMRSGELHYLDHPKFGVLARVDPIAPPETLLAELARLAALPAHRQRPLSSASDEFHESRDQSLHATHALLRDTDDGGFADRAIAATRGTIDRQTH